MYSAKESIYKQAARQTIFSMVERHIPKEIGGHIMSLSNSSLYLERKVLSHIVGDNGYLGSRAFCYERDRKVYRELKSNIKGFDVHKFVPINKDIFDEDVSRGVYSFVWLDFCNSYTDNFMEKISNCISRIRFTDKAILTITLNKQRGQRETKMRMNEIYPNYKDEGFAAHMLNFLPECKEVNRFSYICRDICTRGCFMNVFNFLISKN